MHHTAASSGTIACDDGDDRRVRRRIPRIQRDRFIAVRRLVIILALVQLLPGCVRAARAQEQQQPEAGGADRDVPSIVVADKPPYRLIFDQLSRSVRLVNERGELRGRWDYNLTNAPRDGAGRSMPPVRASVAVAPIPPDRPLLVEIENANPLLYDYDVTAIPVRKLNVRTCRTIGGEFLQQGFIASVAASRGAQVAVPALDSLFRGTFTAEQLAANVSPGGQSKGGDEAALEARWPAARRSVERVIAYFTEFNAFAQSMEERLPLIAELGESQPLDELLRALEDSVALRYPGLRSPRRVPQIVYGALADARGDIATVVELAGGAAAGEPYAAEPAALKIQLDTALHRVAQGYRKLELTLFKVERARSLTRQTFTLPPSGDLRRITVSASATNEFAELPKLNARKVVAYGHPVVRVTCQLSVGIAYMAQPARYEARDARAVNARDDEARTAAAIMLHLAADAWGPFAVVGGIGLGVNRSPDLYVGGSFRLLPIAILNAGSVWQREQRLPSSLAPPAAVTDADLDHLPRSYRAGFFAGLSIAR